MGSIWLLLIRSFHFHLCWAIAVCELKSRMFFKRGVENSAQDIVLIQFMAEECSLDILGGLSTVRDLGTIDVLLYSFFYWTIN